MVNLKTMALLHFFKGLFLFGFHLPKAFANVIPAIPQPMRCGTGDIPPVNLQAEWRVEESCFDLQGNIYKNGEIIKSCCDCLEYTCTKEEREKCVYYTWTESTSETHACCVDCDGVVFPPGEVMNTVQLNDSCESIQTERCEDNTRGGVVVSVSILPTTCCLNSTGLHPLKSASLDPAICSTQTCDRTERHSTAFWLLEKEHEGCDCCVYNGSLVPDGWSTPINTFQNLSCCEGLLQETFLPPLSECHIQNLTYLIDTSGSMHWDRPTWEPVALELIDVMRLRQVDVMDYTLMDFVTTVHVTKTTSSNEVFYTAVDNMILSGGGRELTFKGIRAALQTSSCHNFIAVFTDEIGDDTDDLTLKSEILVLKSLTKSEIFFMVLPGSNAVLLEMENRFADIGHVIDITNNGNAVQMVVELIMSSDICTEKCIPKNRNMLLRRNFGSEPIEVPWLTILRRGQYGNPTSMFSDATFSEYVAGFGDVNEEFWMGLKKLANMTASGLWELRVELVDFQENIYVAAYNSFKVEGAEEKYSLTVDGFKNGSNLQDSLSYHNGMGFSAKDKNNDDFQGNCTKPHGGWWHNSCFQSNLFGNNFNTEKGTNNGIVWRNDENIPEQDVTFSWPFAEMRIKKIKD